jgi:ribose transport system substrate-binding protein
MKVRKPGGAAGVVAVLVAVVFAAGCGSDEKSSDASGGSSSVAETTTPAQPAASSLADSSTVFAKDVAAAAKELPATKVDVGGGKTVSFDEGEKLKIAYMGYGLGFDYTIPQYDTAKEVAKEYAVDLDTFDPAGDGQKQANQLQDVLSSGKYNVVVTYPVAVDLTCGLLSKQLPAKNILVLSHNQAACSGGDSTDGVVSTIWDTASTGGYGSYAKHIVDELQGPQKAIVISGPKGDTSSEQAIDALTKAFAAKNIEILSLQRTDYSTPDSQKKAQDALQANPEATVLVGTYPEGTRGAVSAVRIAGKAGKIKIYDFGGAETAIAQLKSGIVSASTPQYPGTVVRTSIEAAIMARAGKTVPRAVYNAGIAALPEGEAPWVTKENASTFHPEY